MKYGQALITLFMVMTVIVTGLTILGCGSSGAVSETGETTIVEVTRGNLMTTISSFGSISMPEQALLNFGSGGSVNDLYTVSEINVAFGDSVKEGDILAKLDTASLERAVEQEEADLRTAQINLEQATSETSLLKARAAVKGAEISLASAQNALDDAKTWDIAAAEATVRDAEVALANAERSLAIAQQNAAASIESAEDAATAAYEAWSSFVHENISQMSIASVAAEADDLYDAYVDAVTAIETARVSAENSIATAENNLAKAQDTLEGVQEALTDVQLDSVAYLQKEVAVLQAEATLSQAKDDLAYVEAGHDIELLQIQGDNAQDALDEALEQLQAATIVAPFDGVVAAVNASVGDEVTPNEVIIHLVNTGIVEIDAAVDEIDVASVDVGQMAMVTVDALPDARLRGQVTAVSPVATSQSGVVTYDIAVEVQNADQYEVKDGMSATLTIMAMDVQNVLLVPSNAVRRTTEGSVVDVVVGEGQTEERPVETGATNGTLTEIISGLEEGEQVLVQSAGTAAAELPFEPGMRIPGMGGGGGGGGMRPPM